MKWFLYPSVKIARQSFKNVKTIVVPNQSLTLKQILDRFVRRLPLPVREGDGVFIDGYEDVDLEKIQHEDITIRKEMIAELKKEVAYKQEQQKLAEQKAAEAKKLADEKAAQAVKQSDPIERRTVKKKPE